MYDLINSHNNSYQDHDWGFDYEPTRGRQIRFPRGRVNEFGCCHALDNLVIADASIMPGVPRANTNLTCIMIGEMIGEWLRSHPARYGL